MDDLIQTYFILGLHHYEIIVCLRQIHGINISMNTLKRRLKNRQLFRRIHYSSLAAVYRFISDVLDTHGNLHGYRWMHLKCLQNNFVVTQEAVRLILHILDPEGVEIRSRKRLRRREYFNKGPNYLWHMDCYDKLKPYGICISGCIDGFSRQIIWLKAGVNTNNPRIIGGFYLEAVKQLGGCPRTVRADFGKENSIVQQLQDCLKQLGQHDESDMPSFLYGTSTHNQRIGSWWAIVRKHHSQFWMNLFQNLKDRGHFNGSFLDKSLIQFCFLPIIREELDTVVLEWNMHQISRSRNTVLPIGRPFIMYNIPQMFRTRDYITRLLLEVIEECQELCIFPTRKTCDPQVYDIAVLILQELDLKMPENPNDAIDLYLALRHEISDLLT